MDIHEKELKQLEIKNKSLLTENEMKNKKRIIDLENDIRGYKEEITNLKSIISKLKNDKDKLIKNSPIKRKADKDINKKPKVTNAFRILKNESDNDISGEEEEGEEEEEEEEEEKEENEKEEKDVKKDKDDKKEKDNDNKKNEENKPDSEPEYQVKEDSET